MELPQSIITTLNKYAANVGASPPGRADDLFEVGVLDSFSLVDFVLVLEEHCVIHIPDSDIDRANFLTIEAIETYVASRNR